MEREQLIDLQRFKLWEILEFLREEKDKGTIERQQAVNAHIADIEALLNEKGE